MTTQCCVEHTNLLIWCPYSLIQRETAELDVYDLTYQDHSVCTKGTCVEEAPSMERILRGQAGVDQTEIGQSFSPNGNLTKRLSPAPQNGRFPL